MDTFTQLRKKLLHVNKQEIAKKLGYNNTKLGIKALENLQNASSLLEWFEHGFYDLRYRSTTLYQALAKILGFDIITVKAEIKQTQKKLQKLSTLQTPYIFVYTDFQRKNEPIFALAFLEPKRRILLEKKELFDLCTDKVLEKVSQIIKEHFKQNKGKLPLWGEIKSYVYHHIDGKVYHFNKDGSLKSIGETVCENRATLFI